MPSATVYARMHQQYLKGSNPSMLDALQKSGQQADYLRTVGEQAMDLYDTLIAQIVNNPNLPTDPQERLNAVQSAPLVAEEIVLAEIVYAPRPNADD